LFVCVEITFLGFKINEKKIFQKKNTRRKQPPPKRKGNYELLKLLNQFLKNLKFLKMDCHQTSKRSFLQVMK